MKTATNANISEMYVTEDRVLLALKMLLEGNSIASVSRITDLDKLAEPSWISGAGRTIDLWGVFEDFNDSPTAEIADERGLYADWRRIGEDLAEAMNREVESIDAP